MKHPQDTGLQIRVNTSRELSRGIKLSEFVKNLSQ